MPKPKKKTARKPRPATHKRWEVRLSGPQHQILADSSEKFGIPKNQLLTMGFLHFAAVLERLDHDRPLMPSIASEFLAVVQGLQEAGQQPADPEEPEDDEEEDTDPGVAPEPEPPPRERPAPPPAKTAPPPVPRAAADLVSKVSPGPARSTRPPPQAAPPAEYLPELGKQLEQRKAERRSAVSAVDPYAGELDASRRSWFNSSPPASQEGGTAGERADGEPSIIDFG